MEHQTAYAAALYGTMTVVVFLAPIVIYMKEFSDMKRQGGNPGEVLSIISTGVAMHLFIVLFVTLAMGSIGIIMGAAPGLTPKIGIQAFYLNSSSNIIEGWFSHNWVAGGGGGPPMGQATKEGFGIFMLLFGNVLYMLFVAIPAVILTAAFTYSIGKKAQPGEPVIGRILTGIGVFIGATTLVFFHALLASSVVIQIGEIPNFSFWGEMQTVWKGLIG